MALSTTTALVLGGIGAFGAKKAGFFGGAASSAASSPIEMPKAPSASEAADKGAEIARKKRVASTQSVYTSPLGISGEASVARKTLLGA